MVSLLVACMLFNIIQGEECGIFSLFFFAAFILTDRARAAETFLIHLNCPSTFWPCVMQSYIRPQQPLIERLLVKGAQSSMAFSGHAPVAVMSE